MKRFALGLILGYLIGSIIASVAMTGKIWTNSADATIDSGISNNANGNWTFTNNINQSPSGSGLLFDGSNDVINISDHADLRLGTGDFTILAWVKPNNVNQNTDIFTKSETSGNYTGYTLGISSADSHFVGTGKRISCLFRLDNSNEYGVYTNADVVDGNWHHVTCTGVASTKTVTIYIDGASVATTCDHCLGTWGNVNGTNPAPKIGSAETANFAGTMGEVRLYNVALSASTISTDYASGGTQCTGNETGNRGCWKLNETSGTSAADTTGSVNTVAQNGTLSGFTGSYWAQAAFPPGTVGDSPVVTTTELNLGRSTVFDMSSFRATEIKTTGSVKYQYSSACGTPSWNGSWLTRAQVQAVSDITANCLRFKAQLNGAGAAARVDHFTVAYSPYKTVAADVVDTFVRQAAATTNYGATTSQTVGYSSGAIGNYLIKLNTWLVPRETITSVTLNLYLSPGTWASSENLRVFRIKDGAANAGNRWISTQATYNVRTTGNSWVGSVGLETADTDYYSTGDTAVSLALGASFTAGYYSITIPLDWVRGWRDNGEGRGLLVRTESRTGTHTLTLNASEHGTNPAYFDITYALDASGTTTLRVISDEGGGYANFWAGNWHVVEDSQGSTIVIFRNADDNSAFFKYDGHVWDYLNAIGPVTGAGVLLKDSSYNLHFLRSGSGSCPAVDYSQSTYSDDASIFDSPTAFVASNALFDKGTAVIDQNDKIHAFIAYCSQFEVLNYYTKVPGGAWTFQKALAKANGLAALDTRIIWYANAWVSGSSPDIYLAWSDAWETTSEYTPNGFLMSNDGGTTWKNSAGTVQTLPVQFWDTDRVAPNDAENNVSVTSITKHGADLFLSYWINKPGGALGSVYVSNFTGTNNDLNFAGGTGTSRVGQSYTATSTAIGRACFKIKKIGSPYETLFTEVMTSDIGSGLQREGTIPIKSSDVTTSYQTFCQDFPEYTGDARISIFALPVNVSVTNPGFESAIGAEWSTTTPDWLINTGATLTQQTTNCSGVDTGSACGRIVTTASPANQGIAQSISNNFYHGGRYTATVRAKVSSGTPAIAMFFGSSASDYCYIEQAASTSYQTWTCTWNPAATASTAYISFKNGNAGAITIYIDTWTPSSLTNYYAISKDDTGTDSYTGGSCRTYTTSWADCATNEDLNFEIYQRAASGQDSARIRKLTGSQGTWADPAQVSLRGNNNVFVQDTLGNLLYFITDVSTNLNIKYFRSYDGAQTWIGPTAVTSNATADRKYFYPSRSAIVTDKVKMTFQSMFDDDPGSTEASDVYYYETSFPPPPTPVWWWWDYYR